MRNALVLVSLLSSTAFADPTPPPAQPLAVKLTVKVGADTRVHELAIFDNGCGRVADRATGYEDDINICARAVGTGIQIEADWHTKSTNTEYKTRSATVLARKGRFEVGRAGGTRFTLELL